MAEEKKYKARGRALGARDPRRPENQSNRRRQERAYQLFIAGLTYQQIAETPDAHEDRRPWPLDEHGREIAPPLYADKSPARRAVLAAIDRHTGVEETEEMRRVENLRIDALQRAHWAKAMNGDSWSTLRIKELMEMRHRLNGLNAPTKAQIEVLSTDTVQAAIDELTRQIARDDALANALDNPAVAALDGAGEPVDPGVDMRKGG